MTGADTALYIDYRSTVSGECSATQEAPLGAPYPEVEAPPPEPDREDYAYANVMDGAAAGHRSDKVPVTMPPCLRITRGFGCDAFPTGVSGGDRCPPDAPYWHTGVDYSCPRGTPVRTPMGGALVHSSSTGYGRLAMVILSEQGQTLEMYFAHLASFAQSDVCRRGGICHAGSRVGVVGSSGFSTGPHLHWEMRVNDLPVDPFLYYGGSAGSGRPAAASHASGRPVAGRNPGAAALASPARVPPSPEPAATRRPRNRYPLTLRVRDAAGAGVARAQIRLQGIDGENEVAACTSDSRGLCALSLPSGVYRIRLAGEIDGRRIDAVGAPNVRAMEGDGLEYAYGPLALWHEGPGSTVGMVLTGDGSGVLHPLIDADPRGAAPQPLDPVEDLPRTTPTATAADQAPYDTLMPEDAHRRPARLAVGLVSLAAALGLLTFAYYVSRREAR
ncbi:MAG: peptidoglycan DD-metalloendopeptidase family protein [Armatimonadota bacterium]